jgi:hypothetical protein
VTYTAQFEVTDVDGQKVTAKASTKPGSADSVEVGTLTQNTEHAIRMTLLIDIEEGYEPKIKVGDKISAQGHFTG